MERDTDGYFRRMDSWLTTCTYRGSGQQSEGGASVTNGSHVSTQQAAAAGGVADVVQQLTAGSVCAEEEACVMVNTLPFVSSNVRSWGFPC